MNVKIWIGFMLILSLAACSSQSSKERQAVIDAETEFFDANKGRINVESASAMVKKYSDFASSFPEDEMAPEFLFKAAELSMNMNMGAQAILYFEQIKKQYPDYVKMPEVVFMSSFVQENLLNDLERAKSGYTEFIERFKDHALFKDAEASIKNLGKSPEELIREFEAINQTADSII